MDILTKTQRRNRPPEVTNSHHQARQQNYLAHNKAFIVKNDKLQSQENLTCWPPLNTTSDPVSVTAALIGAQPLLSTAGKKAHAAMPEPPGLMTVPGFMVDGGWRE